MSEAHSAVGVLEDEGFNLGESGLRPFIQVGRRAQLFRWRGAADRSLEVADSAQTALVARGFECTREGPDSDPILVVDSKQSEPSG